MSLEKNLRRIIKERGIKILKIREDADLTVSVMSSILNTAGYEPKYKDVEKLAKALNVTVDELVRD